MRFRLQLMLHSHNGINRVENKIQKKTKGRTVEHRILGKAGFEVTCALSGAEGLRLAKEIHPAAITLDVLMPQIDGWKVLKTLKSDPETQDIPVIILTMMSDKSMGLSLGALDFMSKPVDRHQLLQVLKKCCPGTSVQSVLVVDDDPPHPGKRRLEGEGSRKWEGGPCTGGAGNPGYGLSGFDDAGDGWF